MVAYVSLTFADIGLLTRAFRILLFEAQNHLTSPYYHWGQGDFTFVILLSRPSTTPYCRSNLAPSWGVRHGAFTVPVSSDGRIRD
jgi:hypothetical protein